MAMFLDLGSLFTVWAGGRHGVLSPMDWMPEKVAWEEGLEDGDKEDKGIRRTQAEAKSKAQSCLSPAFVWVGASLWSMRPPRLSCSYHLVPYQSHVLKGPRRSRG